MRIGIQLLNYNGMRWLNGALESLKACRDVDMVLYVVDNGSSDDSVAYIQSEHPDVKLICSAENLGYAGAYNRSIPRAFADGCDWVCLQNTDTLVMPSWLDAMHAAAESDSAIGVMGPVFWKWHEDAPNYYMEGRCADVIPFMEDPLHPAVDRDWVEGSSLFIRKECFEHIGGLDSLYFMYWEDAEYCRRARLHGWRVVIVPGSVCRHYAGGSGSGVRSYHQIRNHFLYKLTDPNNAFVHNALDALRLGATYVKQTAWDSPDLTQAIRVLRACGSSVVNAGRCYRIRAEAVEKVVL